MFKVDKTPIGDHHDVIYPKITAYCNQCVIFEKGSALIEGNGQATCDSGDKFDKNFGIELAKIRAEIDMLQNYESILIKMTKQPEWRKEKKVKLNEGYKKENIAATIGNSLVEIGGELFVITPYKEK